jgi:hypothetical protein
VDVPNVSQLQASFALPDWRGMGPRQEAGGMIIEPVLCLVRRMKPIIRFILERQFLRALRGCQKKYLYFFSSFLYALPA